MRSVVDYVIIGVSMSVQYAIGFVSARQVVLIIPGIIISSVLSVLLPILHACNTEKLSEKQPILPQKTARLYTIHEDYDSNNNNLVTIQI